jgi:exonuclease III
MYTTLHDEDDVFPTHINGSKRIDYILCTPNVLQHVEKVGYITFHNALDSDHRAAFCDLHDTILDDKLDDQNFETYERLIGTN